MRVVISVILLGVIGIQNVDARCLHGIEGGCTGPHIRIIDQHENALNHLFVNEKIWIDFDIPNGYDEKQLLSYHLNIINPQNKIIYTESFLIPLQPYQIFDEDISWIPEDLGNYTITVKVFTNATNSEFFLPPVSATFKVLPLQESFAENNSPEITTNVLISNPLKVGETAEVILYYNIQLNSENPVEILEQFYLPVGFMMIDQEEFILPAIGERFNQDSFSKMKTITESGHYQSKITIKAIHERYWTVPGGIAVPGYYESGDGSVLYLKVGYNESLVQDTSFDESVVMNWPSKLELETINEEPEMLVSDSKIFEYQTYQSRTHGFTMEYPTDWTYISETGSLPELRVDDIENKLVTFYENQYSSYSADIPNVAIFFLNNSNFSSNDKGISHLLGLEELLVDHCARTQENFRLTCIEHEIINSKIISVDGKPGYRVDDKWIGVNANGTETRYFGSIIDVIRDDYVWSITAMNAVNENKLLTSPENIDHIIKSLKVTNEAFDQAKSVKKTIVPPLGLPPSSNLRTIDELGNSIDSIKPGVLVIVSADIANHENRVVPYSLIFQVRDDIGEIHFINVISGVLRPGESFSPDTSFDIVIPGQYSVVLYFWEDIERGIPITPPVETWFKIK